MTIKASFLPPSIKGWIATIARHGGKVALFGALLAIWSIALPQLRTSFDAAVRYGPSYKSEWVAMDQWISSAACARRTGILLVMCEGDRLVPFSDHSIADDPGHALVLGIVARIVDRDLSYIDIARINLCINAIGIGLLVALLLGLRLYWAAFLFLLLGPAYFLEWFGPSPHWSFIGVVAAQTVLPIALVSIQRGWLSRRMGVGFVALGLLAMAFGTLIREAVGTMTLIVVLLTLLWVAYERFKNRQALWPVPVIVALAFAASSAAHLATVTRDALVHVEPAHFISTHGMSHTLYIGLGSVENRFGIVYDDGFGFEAAKKVVPSVPYQSPEYLRVMRRLYLERWLEDPLEVIRIYFVKLKIVLGYSMLGSVIPATWLCLLLVAAIHLFSNDGRASCGEERCDLRLAINLVAAAFAGLLILQSVLAVPTFYYAMPLGPILFLMIGISIESVVGWLQRRASVQVGRAA